MKVRVQKPLLCLVLLILSPVAMGASVEQLVMPGPLVEGHADLEGNCNACHIRFDRGAQDSLCAECHEEIAADIAKTAGFHGKHPQASSGSCSACHTDHKGRQADVSGLVVTLFDHNHTNFELSGAHVEAACADCHVQDEPYRNAAQTCVGCHQADDPHEQRLGDECQSCHTTQTWLSLSFDHNGLTDFALRGAHLELACKTCHRLEPFTQTASTCADCHTADDVHAGQRGADCGSCHNEEKWRSTNFDHDANADFPLIGAHAQLDCSSCHLSNMTLLDPPTSCNGCHSSDDPHLGRNGENCAACHTNTTWATEFDHLNVTDYALLGAHQGLSCEACHQGSLSDPIESSCFACHVDDDPHAGELPLCGNCHGNTEWLQHVQFNHELTSFPLLGAHRLISCEQCHSDLSFVSSAGDQCIDCHREDDNHQGSLGSQCATCHAPVSWSLWNFNHDQQTSFILTGAHEGLMCAACHLSASTPQNTCQSCHRSDDPHRGSFGGDCGRCHATDSFLSSDLGRRR